ncbi:TPA: energy-coupling factor transporter ATPase [bacterium]|nr:energy-coupling factor transporter ATPase [bacterium]
MPIKFENVSYTYLPNTVFKTEALKDVNCEIKEGSFTAIIGHTGSGKSTLVQHINALLLPTSGTVFVEDYKIFPNSKLKQIKKLRSKVGLVFQFPEYQLFEETCYKDIAFGPKNFGKTSEEIDVLVKDAAKLVGIDEELLSRSPFELSGGQRRRVAIAGILAMKPSVLILDEPTAGLDPRGAREMMDLFSRLNKQGITVILVTHDMDYVLRYSELVIVMSEGMLKAYDTPLNIFKNTKLCKELNLELPTVFSFANKLIEKGLDIDLGKVKDVKTLADEIALNKGGKQS